jgi:hypothetical protein
MAMTSEQEARAKGLECAVRWSIGSGETTENDRLCLEHMADTFANYIVGYDIKAQAEVHKNANRGW